ncbi:hypothetical protein [Adhaeribacter radiodurans]|uniref:hypothetical protein n=1 Tax=Adhaeribacter radiodurans TaxID=2745197 RepID=UPI001FE5F3A0|nr:hypothetical protein [Adhaeribacter radiodurans]
MCKYPFFSILFSLLIISQVHAQLNNSALEYRLAVKPEYNQNFRIGLNAFGFTRNNEYFNDIADGYTLFGYHFNPKLVYFPAEFVRLEGGVFLWQDFGNNRFTQVRPTFTLKVQKKNYALLFGNLEGNLNHGYIEPLYNFEKVINDNLETGVQFLLTRERTKLDAYIDWERMIYPRDPFREEIAGGLTLEHTLWQTDSGWRLGLPLQFTAQHKGGQIDSSDLPLLTVFNGATGFNLEKKLHTRFWQSLYTKNYYVVNKEFSNVPQLAFEQGHGLYLNAGVQTKLANIMLSYWHGQNYVAEKGGRLFQSATTSFLHPGYLEPDRKLLILRVLTDVKLLDNLFLTVRFEPIYDFQNPRFEFSNSFYLHYNTDLFVSKVKQ